MVIVVVEISANTKSVKIIETKRKDGSCDALQFESPVAPSFLGFNYEARNEVHYDDHGQIQIHFCNFHGVIMHPHTF